MYCKWFGQVLRIYKRNINVKQRMNNTVLYVVIFIEEFFQWKTQERKLQN